MGITRRAAFKAMLAGGAAVAGVSAATRPVSAAPLEAPADALGLLYDATLCIGCKTCVVKCQEANHLEPDTSGIDAKYNARCRSVPTPRPSSRSTRVTKASRT